MAVESISDVTAQELSDGVSNAAYRPSLPWSPGYTEILTLDSELSDSLYDSLSEVITLFGQSNWTIQQNGANVQVWGRIIQRLRQLYPNHNIETVNAFQIHYDSSPA